MFRFRRYRVFLVFASFTVILLYHFTNVRRGPDLPPINGGKSRIQEQPTKIAPSAPLITRLEKQQNSASPAIVEPFTASQSTVSHQQQAPSAAADGSQRTISPQVGANAVPSPARNGGGVAQEGRGRQEVSPLPTNLAKIHWKQQLEHFPVPSESIISLPTGQPKPIPKIQYKFKDESPSARIDREKRLSAIKDAFDHAWTGYKEQAWLHDELRPVTGSWRDPFGGWAATLVDTLDTLWIMDMEEDFQKASLAIGEIDFTTTARDEIPLFETTIRYLGGLLSAYDLSGGKYKVLLAKAEELGEVLMSTFDTPNRMPVTYYGWKPTFASQPHRAGTRVILAELGSLAMEFTRLAQLTGQAKYYDAIARITNELDAWQNQTDIPGLWPRVVDASGCKKPAQQVTTPTEHALLNGPNAPQLPTPSAASTPTKIMDSGEIPTSEEQSSDKGGKPILSKRDLQIEEENAYLNKAGAADKAEVVLQADKGTKGPATSEDLPKSPSKDNEAIPSPEATINEASDNIKKMDCEHQGFASPPKTLMQEFTLGGEADSTFEYLPKQHLLLGGSTPQYQRMYESAMDAASKYLLFRPMVPDERDILVAGTASTVGDPDVPGNLRLTPDQGHLTCFTGGMYAIGAKIFNRPSDLEIARKLTEGCVWAYESTSTGVMPEGFLMIPCDSREKCEWNQTLWYDTLDPNEEGRRRNAGLFEKHEKKVWDARHQQATSEVPGSQNTAEASLLAALSVVDISGVADTLARRQIGAIENDPPLLVSVAAPSATPFVGSEQEELGIVKPSLPAMETYTPRPIPSHQEFAEEKARKGRLPTGITQITSAKYILRPEAIESVFIMYRITGDETWREKGWKMFNAIQNVTKVTYGNSGITDATSPVPNHNDEMESFWLAETLKYFYLLFSTPDVISLDEFVFTTEAHPFKRPPPA